ncbi:MAG: sulfotransferase domain-containing protein [Opitutales bacterium]|jgi:hypothetical protein|nr:sulfotransferase domain-containing protein [Opitutales bacterium]
MEKIPRDRFLIIIGAMKSGTTSLFDKLERTSNICPPTEDKEPHYFSLKTGQFNYDDLWDYDPKKHSWALEASTTYTMHPRIKGVAGRMRDYGIDPKLYYILRNPLDRIVSECNFCRGKDWSDQSLTITDKHFHTVSNYFVQLEEFRKVWPNKKITLLDFEDLKTNSDEMLEGICKELEVPYTPIEFREDYMHKTKIPTRAQDLAYRYKFIRKAANALLPASVRRGINSLPMLGNREKSELTDSQKDYLREVLGEDMRRFKESYGFPVEKWGF